MKHFIIIDLDGLITEAATVQDEVIGHLQNIHGDSLKLVERPVSSQDWFWKGTLRPLPKRPGPWAKFDLKSEQWIDQTDPAELAKAQVEAVFEINRLVDDARAVGHVPGQRMLYTLKANEARRYLLQEPQSDNLSDYPLLASELGITAKTAFELAQIWLNLDARDARALGFIEGIKFTHLARLDVARSKSAIADIVAQAEAALNEGPPRQENT